MLEQMTERGRWIYALPQLDTRVHLARIFTLHGFHRDEDPGLDEPLRPIEELPREEPSPSLEHSEPHQPADVAEAQAFRWVNAEGSASFTVLEREDLEVTLVEARGGAAAVPLGELVNQTGFFAQSALLQTAFDLGSEEARKALTTLAHMVVAWDDDWADLFLLHLASPDPVVRHDAVAALCVAAMVARDPGPAPELLVEAARRETFPKLKETILEAAALVAAVGAG